MVLLTCECRLKRTSVQQIECMRGWQCAGFQWYHVKCVLDEGDEQSLEEFEFLCSHCQDMQRAQMSEVLYLACMLIRISNSYDHYRLH